MRRNGMIFAAALLLAAGVPAAEPQDREQAPEAAEKMRALEFLVGEWTGEAWVQMGEGPRQTLTQHEQVGWEVDDEVLVIRGRGVQPDAGGGERVGHLALATVVWDAERQTYMMWSYAKGRGTGYREIEVRDRGFVWLQTVPGGQARYTMRLDDEGRWIESGEFSPDGGATWHPFLGMTLSRR